MLTKTALVLEGGGMRGVFTAGVLDYFMDQKIEFPFIVGVSAGACNALSYISGQRGRAHFSNIEMLEKYNYIGFKHLLKNGCIMDFDLLFNQFPEKILPYDYDTCFKYPGHLRMVTTNCETGQAMYLEERKLKERLVQIAKASSSLPFVCPVAYVDDIPMLDGGIADAIPFQYALDEGYAKIIVVLTRNDGYRKKEKSLKIPSFIYKKYPALRRQLEIRSFLYNSKMEELEKLERKGLALIIRPIQPIEVDRMEKNTHKLEKLYQEGYQCAMEKMRSFISDAF